MASNSSGASAEQQELAALRSELAAERAARQAERAEHQQERREAKLRAELEAEKLSRRLEGMEQARRLEQLQERTARQVEQLILRTSLEKRVEKAELMVAMERRLAEQKEKLQALMEQQLDKLQLKQQIRELQQRTALASQRQTPMLAAQQPEQEAAGSSDGWPASSLPALGRDSAAADSRPVVVQRRPKPKPQQLQQRPKKHVAASAKRAAAPEPTNSSAAPKSRASNVRVNSNAAEARVEVPVPAGCRTHFFISHCQSSGGDQANAIYLELTMMGMKVWYDNRAEDLTKEGMRQGIEDSAAFVLFLSTGVLLRPFCQFEIRQALALRKPVVLLHEADARYRAFDFRVAYEEAPSDLQELLDSNESLPFRRRGYERDGMLRTLVQRAGFKELVEAANAEAAGAGGGGSTGGGSVGAAGAGERPLAAVPAEVAHVALESFLERPVQAELVELLLRRPSGGAGGGAAGGDAVASCVVVHGMGGTGKTVTAVAAIREKAVREHYCSIYWLTVGADAIDEKVKQLQAILYRQLTGRGTKSEEVQEKDEQEWLSMLVAAMAEQERSLLVLDDPWLPEQVRWLNPIDSGLQAEHRLLVTTRIRDLVPRATRVELPLMGKDEAASLLLDLAGVEKAAYTKEHPESEWPPPAAYTISAECGLLPITLTIAAQVVRSWGDGWETAVLPLLREDQESEKGSTSTVDERVIGAGLQALKDKDAPAIKRLFHMLAVTQEDFVHSMPVIELLWRSCCSSDVNELGGELGTRLKVRQWTQLLVDHSLLLGSSSGGVHLHDIVLTYLRKKRSAVELRTEHKRVVEGMVAASRVRMERTGRGFEDTGSTARAWDGEEVDWYCCNVGSFHVRGAMDPSVDVTENEDVQRWVLGDDRVLVRAAALAVGIAGLEKLTEHYTTREEHLKAAKVVWAHIAFEVAGFNDARRKQVLALIAKCDGSEGDQLELNVLVPGMIAAFGSADPIRHAMQKRLEQLAQLATNSALRADPAGLAWARLIPRLAVLTGQFTVSWDDGCAVTPEGLSECDRLLLEEMWPASRQSVGQASGTRKEVSLLSHLVLPSYLLLPLIPSEQTAASVHAALRTDGMWGSDRVALMQACGSYEFSRHFWQFRNGHFTGMDFFLLYATFASVLEHAGDTVNAVEVYNRQFRAICGYIKADPPAGVDFLLHFYNCLGSAVGTETDGLFDGGGSRSNTVTLFEARGCADTPGCERWFDEGSDWERARKNQSSSADGLHHLYQAAGTKAHLCALLTLAAANSGGREVNASWLDAVGPPEATELHDCCFSTMRYVNTRTLIAEAMEQDGRLHDAVRMARAEIADPFVFNSASRIRAARVLGRCHAAQGQHSLSAAALDSALELAQARRYLLSEALSVRARLLAGLAAGGAGAHWGAEEGRERLSEVVGRMEVEGKGALEAALLVD